MQCYETGRGDPVVLVPGLQGRWEYMRSAVEALAQSHRVITFSLCDERAGRRAAHEPSGPCGLDAFVQQIDAALDERRLERAAICGVSLGGRVALRFAASRPERTSALILASVPGPSFHLKPAHDLYARFPWVFAPLFFAGMPVRLHAEMGAALPDWRDRLAFIRRQLGTALYAPVSPVRMGARARLISHVDTRNECARVSAPTLVITGEPSLDHVVPVDGSSEYGRLIANARSVILEKTGHMGCMTQPARFADAVRGFLDATRAVQSSGHAA